jgi:hypothetical protein
VVGGAIKVVGVLVVVVNGGAGAAVVGLAVGALGGAGGAGAGVDSVVAGPGCSFCGDWLAWPPTRTTVATMTMNAATMAAPIIVRPPSVLNHCVVFGSGSVSVISRSASLADLGIVRRPPDGGDLKRTRDEARIHRSSHDGYQHLSRPGVIRRGTELTTAPTSSPRGSRRRSPARRSRRFEMRQMAWRQGMPVWAVIRWQHHPRPGRGAHQIADRGHELRRAPVATHRGWG